MRAIDARFKIALLSLLIFEAANLAHLKRLLTAGGGKAASIDSSSDSTSLLSEPSSMALSSLSVELLVTCLSHWSLLPSIITSLSVRPLTELSM